MFKLIGKDVERRRKTASTVPTVSQKKFSFENFNLHFLNLRTTQSTEKTKVISTSEFNRNMMPNLKVRILTTGKNYYKRIK